MLVLHKNFFIFTLILVLSTFFLSADSLFALLIDVGDASATPGGSGIVVISISDVTSTISAFGFEFYFDHTVLNYESISRGELTENFDLFSANNYADGILIVDQGPLLC